MEAVIRKPARGFALALVVATSILVLVVTACRSPQPSVHRVRVELETGWPRGQRLFHETSYAPLSATLPVLEDARYVHDDQLCLPCHEAYTHAFATNVHHGDGCESCHGPASRHLSTRGLEAGLIFSFTQSDTVTSSEMCLTCHQEDGCCDASQWRVSTHAHRGVGCVDCHRAHYDVPHGTPATTQPTNAVRRLPPVNYQLASYDSDAPWLQGGDEARSDDDAAADALPWDQPSGTNAADPAEAVSYRGLSCQLGASSPATCYQCHQELRAMEEIADPHQIGGPNGFQCTTCHTAHGDLREDSRQTLCLSCHDDAPMAAWHSTTHFENGVACTDCHNPHPSPMPARVITVSHEKLSRGPRRPMAVQEPEACYRCHQTTYGQFAMPSHHPVREGKMVCSDCHDAHSDTEGALHEPTVNMSCTRCHAEKHGPFLFEHPPVTEDCTICHNVHGSVSDDLLRQPATVLCLRCHSGHHGGHHDLASSATLRQHLYTNCTQCHTQVHGTDRISNSGHPTLMR